MDGVGSMDHFPIVEGMIFEEYGGTAIGQWWTRRHNGVVCYLLCERVDVRFSVTELCGGSIAITRYGRADTDDQCGVYSTPVWDPAAEDHLWRWLCQWASDPLV
jgi:hypothetical protein